ncbi:DUF3800 domain-containing protein [Spiroplasma endosymbiont of Villa modesta]|uniref:DUF3800 domain-containing protein n=1 Tax=Spiroplasma endosymbiont of Villa modesta TaxID=3066293 RepID=UPI00313C9797
MSNNNINEYWLYLDDSGKFLNKSDKHVIYGGIIFNNKNKRNNFIKSFIEAKKKVTKKSEIKGDDIAKKYIKFKKSPYKKADIENLISKYKIIDNLFCVWTCKKDLILPTSDEEHAKLKNNELIALLIKKLIENKTILPNSNINLYIDDIYTQPIQEIDAINLKSYLNKNYSKNGIIRFLRTKNIIINKVKYLDSKIYNCIQACDIIANFCNKYLNKHKDAKQLLNIFENFEFNIIACKFPVIIYNNSILDIKCCWSESSQVNTTGNKVAGVFLESRQAAQQDKE